jgi:hypothetical protein
MDQDGRLPIENELRLRLEALGPMSRRAVLRILSLPDNQRAERIGEFYVDPRLKSLAELLMDIELDEGVRVIVITELQEMERKDRR